MTIYLTDDQIDYLDDVANKIKVKRSTYIRMLIDSDMKGPTMSPSQSQIQWRTSGTSAPYVPPRQRKASGSSRPMDSGKMKVHAELMNELKNVLKKRRVDGDEETAATAADAATTETDSEESDTKKEKWKEKAKWATPPPPPPPSSSVD